jgi:hypothetical protein
MIMPTAMAIIPAMSPAIGKKLLRLPQLDTSILASLLD